MHCISCAIKRKVEKPLLFKQTLKSRFTCLACQHFSFDAKKSLDRERPFSLALRVVSLFSCLSRLAPSVTRVAICVSRVLLDGLQKKETARSLIAFRLWLAQVFCSSSGRIVQSPFSCRVLTNQGTRLYDHLKTKMPSCIFGSELFATPL